MRRLRTALLLAPALVAACAGDPDRRTLAELRDVEPDVTEVRVENSLDQAMVGYKKFLEEAPESALTPEAMRRLADLKLEKEYGILGDGEIRGASGARSPPRPEAAAARTRRAAAKPAARAESEQDFERRAASCDRVRAGGRQRARSSCPAEGRRRRRARSRRSSSTTRSSPPIRTTRTTTRCCTRRRARSTSSGASTRRSP